MGSGTNPHLELSQPLGEALAKRPVHLLTGGGQGVMAAVSKVFYTVPGRLGLVIGILPAEPPPNERHRPAGYPNAWVELSIATHLHERGERGAEALSRNHVNVLTSDLLVFLPGSAGTGTEIELALRYAKPFAVFGEPTEPMRVPEDILVTNELREIERFVDETLFDGRDSPGGL